MASDLHESWLQLVYGPKKRKKKQKPRPREPGRTDSTERITILFPHKRKYWHRTQPPVTRRLKATRHDRDAVKQRIQQQKKPKRLYLRMSKVTIHQK